MLMWLRMGMSICRRSVTTSSEDTPNSLANSLTESLLKHPPLVPSAADVTNARTPAASWRSTMPTTAVCSRPTAAPSSAADGTSINLTRRAFSNGTTLFRLFCDASVATTANTTLFRFAASRTCSTPTIDAATPHAESEQAQRALPARPHSRSRRSSSPSASTPPMPSAPPPLRCHCLPSSARRSSP